MQPTFITDYPIEVSPLARANDADPGITDRFELFVGGKELANGFSELNDPEDQAARFRAQVEAKDAGDDEAMHFDADYIRALEYGLPPTGGLGVGHRPPGDAADRGALDPRRVAVSLHAAGVLTPAVDSPAWTVRSAVDPPPRRARTPWPTGPRRPWSPADAMFDPIGTIHASNRHGQRCAHGRSCATLRIPGRHGNVRAARREQRR